MGMKSYNPKPEGDKAIAEAQKEDDEDFLEFADGLRFAIQHGYRHIDAAQTYRTEKVIGDVVRSLSAFSSLKRSDLFITTKVAKLIRKRADVIESVDSSLRNLQTYVDLFLIHSPHSQNEVGARGEDVLDVYRILLDYQRRGQIRSVGVSNFGIAHLQAMERLRLPLPSVNQIEVNCFLYEKELIEFCWAKGIHIEAYCPIAKADKRVVENRLLNEIAQKYGKTWAQIMMRWLLQKGFIVLVKSMNFGRMQQNGDIFDFEIDDADMQRLATLNSENIRLCWNPMSEPWDV